MTLWQMIVDLITTGLKADKVFTLTKRIHDLNYHMKIAEMSDDRYYTNGRRERDKAELRRLEAELKRLTASQKSTSC